MAKGITTFNVQVKPAHRFVQRHIFESYPGHAGRPGQVGGSAKKNVRTSWVREYPGRYKHHNGWVIERGANGWDVINPETGNVADTLPTLARAKIVYG